MKKGQTKKAAEEAEKPPYVPTPSEKEAMEAYHASRGKRGPRLKVTTNEKNVTRVELNHPNLARCPDGVDGGDRHDRHGLLRGPN